MIGNVSTEKSGASITGSISTASINGHVTGKTVLGDAKVGRVIVTRTDSVFKILTDTADKWNANPTFRPAAGTLIVYTDQYSYEKDGVLHYSPGIKISDGNSYLIDLPFITDYSDEKGIIYSSGTKYEWANRIGYVPKKNELVVVLDQYVVTEYGVRKIIPGIKIGDGQAYALDLPFITEGIESKLNAHIANTDSHIRNEERLFWNRKLNFTINDDILMLNRQ